MNKQLSLHLQSFALLLFIFTIQHLLLPILLTLSTVGNLDSESCGSSSAKWPPVLLQKLEQKQHQIQPKHQIQVQHGGDCGAAAVTHGLSLNTESRCLMLLGLRALLLRSVEGPCPFKQRHTQAKGPWSQVSLPVTERPVLLLFLILVLMFCWLLFWRFYPVPCRVQFLFYFVVWSLLSNCLVYFLCFLCTPVLSFTSSALSYSLVCLHLPAFSARLSPHLLPVVFDETLWPLTWSRNKSSKLVLCFDRCVCWIKMGEKHLQLSSALLF